MEALERQLKSLGEVTIVAPATEQSGVGHSVTYLTPLVCDEVFKEGQHRGWAVHGSPADCVKIGLFEFCKQRPDLVVSGINSGLNAGINVLYSGTVAAAIEGAFFGITSFAVSLEYDERADFDLAAQRTVEIIRQTIEQKGEAPELYNLNIPTAAMTGDPKMRVVPMGVARYGEDFVRRQDPSGRDYYWATTDPPPERGDEQTDLCSLEDGFITLTPLEFDLTKTETLSQMRDWNIKLTPRDSEGYQPDA